ncbi:hypothetical protein J5681_01095 [bacterium]|nr:hypothetical protein [bacterium]
MDQKLPPEIKLFKERFREFLESEAALNGKLLVRELIYRFAMVQFRDTHGFESGKVEYIAKVFDEAKAEFGKIFEEFAVFCIENSLDETFINSEMKEWLTEISKEMELEKAEG